MNAEAATEAPLLVPDRAEAERFILALVGSVDAPVTFQTFSDPKPWREKKVDERGRPWPKDEKGKPKDPLARVRHGTLAACWDELVRLNRAGAGIYMMVNQGDGRGRSNENVRNGGALRALFLDDDSGELTLTALEVVEPSIAVQSRRGPQPYWRLRPGETLEHFRAAQEALAARFGTDPAVKDLARVMRLPGFFHQKDRAEPFPIRIVQVKDVVYSIAEVVVGFGLEIREPEKRARGVGESNGHARCRTEHERRYIEDVIAKARREIESAEIGTRNSKLTKWAYILGGHVGSGHLARSVAAAELAAAASRSGLEEGEYQDVIDRQIDAGALAPLDIPEEPEQREQPPPPESENPPGRGSEKAEKRPTVEYVLTSMASVQPKPVRWLWRDRIAFGKITILDGDPGNGKSTIALDLAARLTTGRPMPGEKLPVGPPMRVLLISIEDDPADTLRPRLDAARANCDLIDTLTIKAKGREVLPVLSDHLVQIEDALEESDAKLLILDPLSALMGRADMFKDQEVRSVLGPLKGVIERHGVANIDIRHFNKSQGGASALYRGGGSIAIAASARSVLAVARNPQSPIQRVLAVSKGNGAEPQEVPSLAYSMEKVLVGDIETIRIRWEGVSAYTADELLAAQVPESREERGALDEAKDFLLQVLGGGPILSTDLEKQRKAAGVAETTLKRARGALGVKAKYIGGRWLVSLPDRSPATDDPLDPLDESDGSP